MAKSIKPYATVFPFFSERLDLHGSNLLTFSVIFSFWRKQKTPVPLSYSMIRTITGLSRSSVGKAIRYLSERGIITKGEARQGHISHLSVVLPEDVRPEEWNVQPVRERDGDPSENEPSPRPKTGPTNKEIIIKNNTYGSYISRALAVPDVKRFDDGDTW